MTLKNQIELELKKVLESMGISGMEPKVEYPADSSHGDYATNVAMSAFGKYKGSSIKDKAKNPLALAKEIASEMRNERGEVRVFEKVEVAEPGFINFFLADKFLIQNLQNGDFETQKNKNREKKKKIVVEFAHPNTHKLFHIGHLRNITTGESIVRILEAVGNKVIRANYQGDVGMHIAKAIFGLLQNSDLHSHLSAVKNVRDRVDFLGKAYITGSKAYDADIKAKKEIIEINKKIYSKDSSISELYNLTRQWSLDYFELIYKRLGSHFDRFYFESEVHHAGWENVMNGLKKGIFEKSDGAIIFPGSNFGLHDRVFITSEGNPSYEGKEMGLGPLQFEEFNPDRIIHVVGPEQSGFFQVVFEALAQLFPETRGREEHLAYGWVKLKHGKMSSRSGNVVLGEEILDEAKKKIAKIIDKSGSKYEENEKSDIAEKVAVGAVKYSFLKVSTQQEIAFDINESINFEGNSGPYVQYAFARTQSILAKFKSQKSKIKIDSNFEIGNLKLEIEERVLLKLLIRFEEIVIDAAENLAPNSLCAYLFELAQMFNLFYQKHQIIKADSVDQKAIRLLIVKKTGQTLKKGLEILGIQAPVKM